jgi:hypothetical protein
LAGGAELSLAVGGDRRLISGTAGLVGVPSPEHAYIFAAWSSWLIPLAACEIVERYRRTLSGRS